MINSPRKGASACRLFLVDDEPAVLRGLKLYFNLHADLEVCGQADNQPEALADIVTLQPDLVVVDLSLREGDGLSLIRQLRRLCPAVKILVYSMHNEKHYIESAFGAGAHGYVTKEEGTEKALAAVQAVSAGQFFMQGHASPQAPMPRL